MILGNQPLANNLLNERELEKLEPRFPLAVQVCTSCWLVQLTHLVPAVELFSDYVYFSSYSETMLKHAREASEQYCDEFGLGNQSFVVEVASNDGYLLKNFVRRGIPCLGIEPAENVATAAREAKVPTEVAFFGNEKAEELVRRYGKADLILGNNVFAHVPDINAFVGGLAVLLKPNGAAILEFPYFGELIDNLEFDTIYHEHVFYFYLSPLVPLFARHGLEVEHVERLPIHGGSLRVFVRHQGVVNRRACVDEILNKEDRAGVRSAAFYSDFAERVKALAGELEKVLVNLRRSGKRIAAYGASAKGSTLLNYLNLPENTLEFIADRSPHKQCKFSPGAAPANCRR